MPNRLGGVCSETDDELSDTPAQAGLSFHYPDYTVVLVWGQATLLARGDGECVAACVLRA